MIRPDGSVHEARLHPRDGTNFLDTDIGRCVQKVVESLRFPARTDDASVLIAYPFTFK